MCEKKKFIMLRIFNTLTNKKERFEPIKESSVKMFVCGPTVYDHIHLGHARTYISYDVMARYLLSIGYDLFYLVNITDIDDAVFSRAKEEGLDYKDVVEKYTQSFLDDMKSLNVSSVTKFAKASDYLDKSIDQVMEILEEGYAYEANGKIYFDTSRFRHYGKLSGQSRADLLLRRLEQSPHKRNQSDFVLWRRCDEEPFWESQFGKGRPGWHIEDTAISITNFGPQYDIHGGAADLIFPHHDAEIAQAEALTGRKPFVRFWVHAGTLKWKGEKMSKSRKNFITVKEAINRFTPDVLRLYFLSHHYREDLDYMENQLARAQERLKLISQADVKLSNFNFHEGGIKGTRAERLFLKPFLRAVDDDFRTPKALERLLALSRAVVDGSFRAEEGYSHKVVFKTMIEILGILGSPVPGSRLRS